MENERMAYPEQCLRFLGTAGARFTTMHQMRATGGIWFRYGGFQGVVDPGPGSLVHLCRAVPELDPTGLDGVLLTHRHLDHCTDLNVLVEALVDGGFRTRGTVLLPEDALRGEEPVLFRYLARKVEHLRTWSDGIRYPLGDQAEVEAVKLQHHGVQCFGLVFRAQGLPSWGVISDTRPLPLLVDRFQGCEILVLHLTLDRRRPELDHFSVPDARELLAHLSPRLLLLTHLGRGILNRGPEGVAEELGTLRSRVCAARDGMVVDLAEGTCRGGGLLCPPKGSHTDAFLERASAPLVVNPHLKEVLPS